MKNHYCPSCKQRQEIPEHYEGKSVRCPHCDHSFVVSDKTLNLLPVIRMPSEEPEYEAPKPTESVPENMSSSSNEKLFTFIGLVLVVIIIGLIAFIATTHEKKPTGYETTTKFVEDGDYRDEREFEDMMTEGWEVMHQRRAWSERYYGASKDWGTEYTMRKPTFD